MDDAMKEYWAEFQKKTFVVCRMRIQFSDDFGGRVEAWNEVSFDVRDEAEGDLFAAILMKNYYLAEMGALVPLRLMHPNVVIKEYKKEEPDVTRPSA